jgi:hypothetical protein
MIARLIIGAFERSLGEDASYMRDIAAVSGRALRRFVRLSMFSAYRRHAARELISMTRMGAVMAEDCGPCVRIVFKLARRDSTDVALLRAALAGGSALQGEPRRAYFFGRAVALADIAAAGELGDAIEAVHGRKVRTELALAAAMTRVFPAVKRGLGYAQTCSMTAFADL